MSDAELREALREGDRDGYVRLAERAAHLDGLAILAETDEDWARRYIEVLRRVPHPNFIVMGRVTMNYGDGGYSWTKWLGPGPICGTANELNTSPFIAVGMRVALVCAQGRFFFGGIQ